MRSRRVVIVVESRLIAGISPTFEIASSPASASRPRRFWDSAMAGPYLAMDEDGSPCQHEPVQDAGRPVGDANAAVADGGADRPWIVGAVDGDRAVLRPVPERGRERRHAERRRPERPPCDRWDEDLVDVEAAGWRRRARRADARPGRQPHATREVEPQAPLGQVDVDA